MTESAFYIIAGSLSDLTKFDFSCYNVQILSIDSLKFHDICKQAAENERFDKIWHKFVSISNKFEKNEKPYVILPLDFQNEIDEWRIYECFKICLILFPSELTVYSLLRFKLFEKKFIRWEILYQFDFIPTGRSITDCYLKYDENNLDHINRFINFYYSRKQVLQYLETTINSYINSFKSSNTLEASFLLLCISLESIINGTNELRYRICRNIALICAENESHAQIIYKNLDQIYKLRSKIIHGENYKTELIQEYLPYLEIVLSRLIIELILQNFKSKNELNDNLLFAGFKDKFTLKNEYNSMIINTEVESDIFSVQLKSKSTTKHKSGGSI